MNEHIRLGNEALKEGDYETAKIEFYEALADTNEITQRIAQNRLMELFPSTVYGSTHSHRHLYHRATCIAVTHGIHESHIIMFRDWMEAEETGYSPCDNCKPPKIKPGFRK